MRIFLLDLLLLEGGKIFQLNSMFKLPHMCNKLKGRILLLKPCLEDHFSRLQMIILRVIKMFLISSFSKYTFVKLNNRLFKETISFLGSIVRHWVFWWPFPWAIFFLVYFCLLGLSGLASATFFFTLCASLFLASPRLCLVFI